MGLTALLEEDLGSDGEAGRASNSQSCVILTTQTRCLMTGGNNTHATHTHTLLVSAQKAALCVIISPKQERTKLITAIRERGRRGKGEKEEKEKKWEESRRTRSWRLMMHSMLHQVQKVFYESHHQDYDCISWAVLFNSYIHISPDKETVFKQHEEKLHRSRRDIGASLLVVVWKEH